MNSLRDDELLDAIAERLLERLGSRLPSSLEMRLALGLDAPLTVPELARMLRRGEDVIRDAVAQVVPHLDGRIRLYRYRDVVAVLQGSTRRPGEGATDPPTDSGRSSRSKGRSRGARWSL